MNREKAIGTCGWVGLVTYVALFDTLCPNEATLSEALDGIASTRLGKLAILGAGAYITAHLANVLPPQVDLFNGITRLAHAEEVD